MLLVSARNLQCNRLRAALTRNCGSCCVTLGGSCTQRAVLHACMHCAVPGDGCVFAGALSGGDAAIMSMRCVPLQVPPDESAHVHWQSERDARSATTAPAPQQLGDQLDGVRFFDQGAPAELCVERRPSSRHSQHHVGHSCGRPPAAGGWDEGNRGDQVYGRDGCMRRGSVEGAGDIRAGHTARGDGRVGYGYGDAGVEGDRAGRYACEDGDACGGRGWQGGGRPQSAGAAMGGPGARGKRSVGIQDEGLTACARGGGEGRGGVGGSHCVDREIQTAESCMVHRAELVEQERRAGVAFGKGVLPKPLW